MSTTVSAQVKHTNYDELNQQVLKSVFGDFPSSKTSLGNSSSEYRCVMCTKNSRLTKLKAIVDSSECECVIYYGIDDSIGKIAALSEIFKDAGFENILLRCQLLNFAGSMHASMCLLVSKRPLPLLLKEDLKDSHQKNSFKYVTTINQGLTLNSPDLMFDSTKFAFKTKKMEKIAKNKHKKKLSKN